MLEVNKREEIRERERDKGLDTMILWGV